MRCSHLLSGLSKKNVLPGSQREDVLLYGEHFTGLTIGGELPSIVYALRIPIRVTLMRCDTTEAQPWHTLLLSTPGLRFLALVLAVFDLASEL